MYALVADRLVEGSTRVSASMVEALEPLIDEVTERFELPKEFVVPGSNRRSAALDVARTVVRRAERESLAAVMPGSHALAYLNRLSDLLWTLARWQDGTNLAARDV